MANSTARSPTSPMTSFCSSRIRGTAGSMAIRRSNSSASTCRRRRNSKASPSARAKAFSRCRSSSSDGGRDLVSVKGSGHPGPQSSEMRPQQAPTKGQTQTIREDGTSADHTGRENNVKSHPASLSAFALLGKNTPRLRSQGYHLELGRNSGMDTAPQTYSDDGRLSANSDPSSRGRVLLRHAAHSSGHRRTGHLGVAL